MKKPAGIEAITSSVLFSVIFALTISVSFVILMQDDTSFSSIWAESIEFTADGIKDIDIEFKDRAVQMNVYLDKPLSCNEVISLIGIPSLSLSDRTLSPQCRQIRPNLVRIIYVESTDT